VRFVGCGGVGPSSDDGLELPDGLQARESISRLKQAEIFLDLRVLFFQWDRGSSGLSGHLTGARRWSRGPEALTG